MTRIRNVLATIILPSNRCYLPLNSIVWWNYEIVILLRVENVWEISGNLLGRMTSKTLRCKYQRHQSQRFYFCLFNQLYCI